MMIGQMTDPILNLLARVTVMYVTDISHGIGYGGLAEHFVWPTGLGSPRRLAAQMSELVTWVG